MLGRFGGDGCPGDAWGPQDGGQQPGALLKAPHGAGRTRVPLSPLQLPGPSPVPTATARPRCHPSARGLPLSRRKTLKRQDFPKLLTT